MKFPFVYNFKTLTIAGDKFAKFIGDYDASEQQAILAHFAEVKEGDSDKLLGYKRNAVNVELELPEFAQAGSGLPELAVDLVKSYIADFVKSQYIDQFLPVGQHDWAFIESTMAEVRKRGGGLAISVSEEQWALASQSIATFLQASNAPAKLVDALSKIIAGKVRASVIKKSIGSDAPEVLEKLQVRFTDWALWAAEHDAENADTFAVVYQAANANINKMLKQEANEDLLNLL